MAMSSFQLVILTTGLFLLSAESASKCKSNDQALSCEYITGDELNATLLSFQPPKKGLILSNFQVNYISADMFKSISFVESLSIVDSPNVLTIDENAFRGLDALESIVIKDTSVNDLPENLFLPVRKTLKFLELIGNEFTTLPVKIFQGLDGLMTIDLSGNPLVLPPVAVFSYPSLNRTTVLLKDNNISCSPCTPSMVDMASLINDRNYPIHAECAMSAPNPGTMLIKDLGCDKIITSRTTTATTTKLPTSESITDPLIDSTVMPETTTTVDKSVNGCPVKCSCDDYENALRCDTVTKDELRNILASIKPSKGNASFILNNFQANEIAIDEFEKIPHIKHLAITDSPRVLSIAEDAFQGLGNVESVFINGTSIKELPENLFYPVRATLRFLELTNNNLTTLHNDTFKGMEVLQTIDLTGNPLQLPQAAVFNHPGLNRTVVRLKDNDISCSPCSQSIIQMVTLINEKNYPISIECNTPDNLAGKKLNELTQDDLNCGDMISTMKAGDETVMTTTAELTTLKETTMPTTPKETTMPTTKEETTMPTTQKEPTRQTTLSATIPPPKPEKPTKMSSTSKVLKSTCPKKCGCSAEAIECTGITENDLAQITKQMNKTETYILIKKFKASKIGADLFKSIPDISKIAITESPDVMSIDGNAFRSLKSCKSITIMDTLITKLPENLFTPVADQLHNLDLMNNKLTTFGTGTFRVIKNLRTLDLSGNQLSSHLKPNKTLGSPLLSRTAIRLLHNNISCDPCAPSVKELLELIHNRSYTISVECGSPEKFFGSLLETLSHDQLQCYGTHKQVSTSVFNYSWLIVAGAIILAGLCVFGIFREFRQHKYKLIKDREAEFFSLDDDPDTMADMEYDDPYDELPLLEVNSNLRKSLSESSKLV